MNIRRKSRALYLIGGICVFVIVALLVCIFVFRKMGYGTSPYAGIEQIRISQIHAGTETLKMNIISGDVGSGGIMAEDISRLDEKSPWSEAAHLTEMPVLRNNAASDSKGVFGTDGFFLDKDQMTKIAKNTATAFGVWIAGYNEDRESITFEAEDSEETEGIEDGLYALNAVCSGGVEIRVYSDGNIFIDIGDKDLPEQYHFTNHDTTDEEAAEALEYLKDKYASLAGYKNPKVYSCVDKFYDGDDNRSYYMYDEYKDLRQSIISHDIGNVEFEATDDGKLYGIWIHNPFCTTTYVGDYPIISVDSAREKLFAGDYYTSIPDEECFYGGELSADNIVKVDINYHRCGESYYIPYYRFFVELDPEKSEDVSKVPEGAKLYGMLYVPAVEPEYLDIPEDTVYAGQ